MSADPKINHSDRLVEFHLLGNVPFDRCYSLQRRLAFEAAGRNDGRIVVLFCEHPELITVGRSGSRRHIRLTGRELQRRRLDVKWVNRSGGCVLHAPGQLAVYPIVPLDQCGWTLSDHRDRLQLAIQNALAELNISAQADTSTQTIRGKTGVLAATGFCTYDNVTCHGAYLNVAPAMADFGFVDVAAASTGNRAPTMSSLLAERRQPIRMSAVRSLLIEPILDAFSGTRHHLYTGHPLMATLQERENRGNSRRVG